MSPCLMPCPAKIYRNFHCVMQNVTDVAVTMFYKVDLVGLDLVGLVGLVGLDHLHWLQAPQVTLPEA